MEKNVLGIKIQQLRKLNKMSQKDLAEKLCVSNKTISKWECGNGTPDIETLNVLASIFSISIDELINEKGMIGSEISSESTNEINSQTMLEIKPTTITKSNVDTGTAVDTNSAKDNKNNNKKILITSVAIGIISLIGIVAFLCYLFIPRNPGILKTNLFSIDENNSTLYCIVDNSKSILELSDEIEVPKNNKWGLYYDLAGINEISSKTVNLSLGDNVYYLIIENSVGEKKVYTATIRRKPLYDVIFDSAGGNEITSKMVMEGEYIEPKIPVKEGYKFEGWYHNDNLYDFNKNAIKADMKFTAMWSIVTYTIRYETYDSDVDNSKNHHTSYTVNTETIKIEDIEKRGYIFGGWYDGEDFNKASKVTEIKKGTTGNITLYAKWTAIVYSISYETFFPEVDNNQNKTSYTVKTESFDILDIVKRGYLFKGWYDSDNFETANQVQRIEQNTTENIKLYAKWDIINYSINYELYVDDVDNSLNKSTYNIESDTFSIFGVSKKGYTFGGWYDGENFETANIVTEIEKGSTEDINLFAKWNIITYKINYVTHYDDVENSSNRTVYTVNTETFDILDVSKKGYKFEGWYDSENYEIANKVSRVEKGSTVNMTLFAKWVIENYSITYETTFPEVDNSLNITSYNILTDTFKLINLSKNGYKFNGWYDGEIIESSNKITEIKKGTTGNIKLYAKWDIITYTINYVNYYADADNSLNRTSYTVNTETFEIFGLDKKGYTFDGWFDDVDFETANKVTKIEKGSTKNYTLYAKWTVIQYKITYHFNGELPEDTPQTYTIEDGFTLNIPYYYGYLFLNWYDKEVFVNENIVDSIRKGSTGDKEFYAKYTDEFDHEGYRRIDSTEDFLTCLNTPEYFDDNMRLYKEIILDAKETTYNQLGVSSSNSNPFTAIFDGNGYHITQYNLSEINNSNYVGIFGNIKNATIKNLTVIHSSIYISVNTYGVGGLVGYASDSVIENCYISIDVNRNVTSSFMFPKSLGGICASATNTRISNCFVSGNMYSYNTWTNMRQGGLVGYMVGGLIENCYATGFVELNNGDGYGSSVGGLVGCLQDGEIKNSFATGNVRADNSAVRAGGLVGHLLNGTITNSFATGNVLATNCPVTSSGGTGRIGGLVGYVEDGNIVNCYECSGQSISGTIKNNTDGYEIQIYEEEKLEFNEILEFISENFDSSIWNIRETELPNFVARADEKVFVFFRSSTGEDIEVFYIPENYRIEYYTAPDTGKLFLGWYYDGEAWDFEGNVAGESIILVATYSWIWVG